MSFTIKPISATLKKDLDTFTKMDPYVKLTIGNKTYRSKTHISGGKKPSWNDTFQVIVTGDLLMKVQVWDQDIIKDDFLGEGFYNLGQLMNTPGIVENQYIDLVRYGKSFGRVLISMKFNPPPQIQNYGPSQYQQPWNVQGQMPLQNYGNYGPNQNTSWNNPPGCFTKGQQPGWNNPYQPQNQGWGNTPYNQENIPPYYNPKGNQNYGNYPNNPYYSR